MYTKEQITLELLKINERQNQLANKQGDLSGGELDELDNLSAQFKLWNRRLEVADSNKILSTSSGRQTEPDVPGQPRPYGSAPRITTDQRTELGKYFWAVKAKAVAERVGGQVDPESDRLLRFYNAPTSVSTEGTGADAGYAVPPQYASGIWKKTIGEPDIARFCTSIPTTSNQFVFPKDEGPPWSSSGIQANWEGEASAIAESKVALESETLKLSKVAALVPVSEELLEDAPGLTLYFERKVPEIFNWKLSNAILTGTGAGQPLGILNAGCTVSVAKDSGQAADSVTYSNILSMWSRMYGPSRANSLWLYNQDLEPSLLGMMMTDSNGRPIPVFMPSNNLAGRPFNTILGSTALPHQACKTLGDQGDIIFGDFSQYVLVTKAGGLKQDVSIHLYFNYDLSAFRWTLRVTGKPWWRAAITPASGSANTLSPFVVLDERT